MKPTSPCVDAGKNADWMWDAADQDGNPRIMNAVVDMGAYEYTDGVDATPPYVWDRDPAADALRVPVSSNIALHAKDQLTGVDETSIVMTVNGSEVIPTITGTPMDYMVSYDPPVDFPYGETVTVTVDAADLSSPANVMEKVTYSFAAIREPFPARTWYVDGSVKSSGDGTSWETAFKKIQEGIDAAEEGDAVIVAPMAKGRYAENIHFRGKNIVLSSTDPLDPNVVEKTIIRGGPGSVVTFVGTEDETCFLSGFTVRGGRAPFGGGILGGTVVDHCLATIQNNFITANASNYGGGGLCYCDGEIRNNIITRNSSIRNAGGVSQCDGTITENTIADNQATGTNSSGAGLAFCDGTIIRNVISGNSADGYGAGLCWCGGAILSNAIVRNISGEGRGLLRCNGVIQNNTIAGNCTTGFPGVGWGLASCGGTMANCIIWGNTAPTGPQVYESRLPTYSCIQSWTGGGEGNIVENPQFVNSTGGDYRLSENSPCIDAGKNEEWTRKALDLGGNLRIWRGKDTWTVDMGAYEYCSSRFGVAGVLKTDGKAQLTWKSRPGDTYVIWSCSDLSTKDPWSQEATVPSAGETTGWTDPDMTSTWKFYRIDVE